MLRTWHNLRDHLAHASGSELATLDLLVPGVRVGVLKQHFFFAAVPYSSGWWMEVHLFTSEEKQRDQQHSTFI